MLSAFGVDHGEISKAARFKVPGTKRATRPTRAQRQTRGVPGGATGPQRVSGKLSQLGEAHISLKGIGGATGRGLGRVGTALERHPGLTGTALVGGGGAAGYKVLSDKQPKRQR